MAQNPVNAVLIALLEQVVCDLETALVFPSPPKPLVQKANSSLEVIIAEMRKLP